MIRIQPVNPRWHFLVDRIESGIARDYTTRYDRNGNGVVEQSEFSGDEDLFERIDRNGDDRLELSEVKRSVDLLGEYEPAINRDVAPQTTDSEKGPDFSVPPHLKLAESVTEHFSEEVRNLDENGNGFLDQEEFVGNVDEFSSMDQDQNSLVSGREWAEAFLDSQTEIQMALKAYRFSHGLFQNRGGILRTTA